MPEALAYRMEYQDEIHTELIDGKIVAMSPRPSIKHGNVAFNVGSIFRQFLKGNKCQFFFEPDVYLSKKDRFVPDIAIVCNPDIVKDDGIHGTPDLVVEVLSPSTARRDKIYKKNTYERHGVKEYWLVEVAARSVEVYLLDNGAYTLDNVYTLYPEFMLNKMNEEEISQLVTKFRPSIFPDLVVDLDEVFEGITR